jgi:hypothetical protein
MHSVPPRPGVSTSTSTTFSTARCYMWSRDPPSSYYSRSWARSRNERGPTCVSSVYYTSRPRPPSFSNPLLWRCYHPVRVRRCGGHRCAVRRCLAERRARPRLGRLRGRGRRRGEPPPPPPMLPPPASYARAHAGIVPSADEVLLYISGVGRLLLGRRLPVSRTRRSSPKSRRRGTRTARWRSSSQGTTARWRQRLITSTSTMCRSTLMRMCPSKARPKYRWKKRTWPLQYSSCIPLVPCEDIVCSACARMKPTGI